MSDPTSTGPSPSIRLPPSLPESVTRLLLTLAATLDTPPESGSVEALGEDRFDSLARTVFRHQFESNPVYRAFCEGRGAGPDRWEGWTRVPAVPTRAFREFDFVSGDPDAVERVFYTSGTTRGTENRGRHPVLSLDLYREMSMPWFSRHLLPEGGPARVLSLVPSDRDRPESSLATMVGFVLEAFGDDSSEVLVDGDHALRVNRTLDALEAAEATREVPVVIIGTAFSFVHLLDMIERKGRTFTLPDGARVMETGGFKGRSRAVTPDELYLGIESLLGVPAHRIVNEYGMTELLSQFYRGGRWGAAGHVAPPWTRTRILDPSTLEPVPAGSPGLLMHFDLANVGSIAAVLTEDMGVASGPGFEVLGRAPGAESRGCSLAVEELLDAAR